MKKHKNDSQTGKTMEEIVKEKIDKLIAKSRQDNCIFKEREFFHGEFKLVWEYINEGILGEYDPMNPEDYPHLRFSCYKRPEGHVKGHDDWEQMDNASYCTNLPITTPRAILKEAAYKVLLALDSDYKKRLEEISWFSLDMFKTHFEGSGPP